jgi:GTPase SAR1 family protein
MVFLSDPTCKLRLCVLGAPGVGKTSWIMFAIRMLLLQGETVVYHIRGNNSSGWYFEFIADAHAPVVVSVYPENVPIDEIGSLKLRSTYYIVDPGKATDSCLPPASFKPKFMLVASLDDRRHWGGSAFAKKQCGILSVFKLFPVWDANDNLLLRAASTHRAVPTLPM